MEDPNSISLQEPTSCIVSSFDSSAEQHARMLPPSSSVPIQPASEPQIAPALPFPAPAPEIKSDPSSDCDHFEDYSDLQREHTHRVPRVRRAAIKDEEIYFSSSRGNPEDLSDLQRAKKKKKNIGAAIKNNSSSPRGDPEGHSDLQRSQIVNCGPYGSQSPQNYYWVLKEGESIKKVLIRHGFIVDAIGFVIETKCGNTLTPIWFGGTGGNESEIVLKPGEYITRISGEHGNYEHGGLCLIGKIRVHTNLCPIGHGPYGQAREMKDKSPFSTPFPTAGPIVGIFGRHSDYLESVGIYVKQAPNHRNSKCCIYRVPLYIRKGKKDCYRPLVISIGPAFCKGYTELETMQNLKWIYLKYFLNHPGNAYQTLEPFVNEVRECQTEIVSCYQEEILQTTKLSEEELVETIVVDAAFLIYLFLVKSASDECPSRGTPAPPVDEKLRVLMNCLQRDLFLEENQLPFRVLTLVYEKAFGKVYPRLSLIDLALEYIGQSPYMPGEEAIESIIIGKKITDASSVKHLVDLRRICCCLPFYNNNNKVDLAGEQSLHKFDTAKQLSAGGVKFRLNPSVNPLDIKFDPRNGELKIPKIILDDNIEAVMRSILFFEQCYYSHHTIFFDYVIFLDKLIDTVEDIQVLQQKGILENQLGSDEEAAELFNKVHKNLYYSPVCFTFSQVTKDLKDYSSKPWHEWRAIFWRKYFNHPWAVISVIYAIFLLILTVLQTVASFKFK